MFLAGGLVCERWEGVTKIVVCVYIFFLGAVLHLIPTKALMEGYDEHYEVSLFLDNALYSDYRLVTFYLR